MKRRSKADPHELGSPHKVKRTEQRVRHLQPCLTYPDLSIDLGAKATRTPANDGSEPLSRAARIGGKEKLNHKQRRRAEALEDAKKDSSNPAGAIKAAKKAARPVKLNSLEAAPVKPGKAKGKKDKKTKSYVSSSRQ